MPCLAREPLSPRRPLQIIGCSGTRRPAGDLGNEFQVLIQVQHGKAGGFHRRSDDQIGDGRRAVPRPAGKPAQEAIPARIRVPEPCRLHDEVHAAGSGLPVWLVSNVVSFAWVRGYPLSPTRHSQASSRTMVNSGERRAALLESVLGATPQEFESPILRHL